MDIDNIECVSTIDMDEDEIIHHHHHQNHHQFSSSKAPHNNNGVLNSSIHPATSVHELLECPVCTNSMYPPIHQVFSFSYFLSPLLKYAFLFILICFRFYHENFCVGLFELF